jgi:hypothetical protein
MTTPEYVERRLLERGLPAAGTTGQVLAKTTDADYEASWSDVTLADGSVTTAKIADDAVTTAKIAQGTAGQLLLTNATPDTAWVTVTGDVTISSAGVTSIANNAVTTAKIGNDQVTTAKIAQGTAGQLLISNATPDTAWVSLSGDATVAGSGALTIANNAVTTAKIGDDQVTTAKIAQGTAGQILISNATPDTAWVTVTGDVTISSAGVTSIAAGSIANADLSTASGELGAAWSNDAQIAGFTNVTGGSFQRRWVLIGKTLHFRGWFVTGTATAIGSVGITLPGGYTAITGRNQVLYGVNTATIVTVIATNATGTVTIYSSNAGGTFAAGASLTNLTIQGTIQVT